MPTAPGDLELSVLVSVARLGNDAYGRRIQRDVSEVRRHSYSPSAIYITLGRLEAKGLLRTSMSAPLPVRGGRSRRLFHLTAAGRRAVQAARAESERLWTFGGGTQPA